MKYKLHLAFILLTFTLTLYSQNSPDTDGDTYFNATTDLDDDNDGILDTQECDQTLSDIYTAFVNGQSNFYDSNNPNAFMRIRPSDFGYSPNGQQQSQNLTGLPNSISKDYSDFFDLPTGSIIVTVENPHIHATADEFFINARPEVGTESTVVVSGTIGVYVQYEHNIQYFPNETRTLTINDGSNIADGSLFLLGHQDADGVTWNSDKTDPSLSVSNITSQFQPGPAQINYAAINPQIQNKSVTFATDDVEPTHMATFFVRIFPECDTDKDGIPNRLDTDSDNDGCPDAIEADGNLTSSNLSGEVIAGSVDNNGIPQTANGGYAPEGTYDSSQQNTECNTVLPVKLVYFEANNVNKGIELKWSTALEINNSHFEIQRSLDGNIFQTIGSIQGAGNSTQIVNYQYIDTNANSNSMYYQLKQVDFDGRFELSDFIHISINHKDSYYLLPNIVERGSNIKVLGRDINNIHIYNYAGILIKEIQLTSTEQHILSTNNLQSGMYIISINDRETLKMIII